MRTTRGGRSTGAGPVSVGVRLSADDLYRDLRPVGGRVGHRFTDALAIDRLAQRRVRGVDLDAHGAVQAAQLTRAEQERLDVVLVEGDFDDHAGLDHAVVRGRLTGPGTLQQRLQLRDPSLLLALLVLGSLIPAVLREIPLEPRVLDALGDLGAPRTHQMRELLLKTVVCLLGEPGDVIARGRHGMLLAYQTADQRLGFVRGGRSSWPITPTDVR